MKTDSAKTAGRILFALLALISLSACKLLAGPEKPDDSSDEVGVPLISPSGGNFVDATLLVSIRSDTPGAHIFWTQDGADPTPQSSLYTEPIRLWGSTTIKAIAVSNGESSSVATAVIGLNEGRGENARGLIKGRVSVDANAGVAALDSINIFSDQLPGIIKHPDGEGFFVFDGLDPSKAYTIYFTNQEVGPIKGSRRLGPRQDGRALGDGLIVATQVASVVPGLGAGVDLGDVRLKKTGSISGTVTMVKRDGSAATDNTGIDVYVPGTSFFARTDSQGRFLMTLVPQGAYSVRAEKAGFTFREVSGVLVRSEQETQIPDPMTIRYGYGTVTGQAFLRDGSTENLPSEGIQVLMRNLDDPNATFDTVTSSDGSFVLTNVEPGSYIAFFQKDGYVTQTREGISVEEAKVASIPSVSLPAVGGRLSGLVPVSGETDLAGSIVIARNEGNGKVFSTATLSDGAWTIDPIAPGLYTITAARPGFSTRVMSGIAIASGEAFSLPAFSALVPTSGTVTGTVLLEGSASFGGIAVTLRKSDDGTQSHSAFTDGNGTYVFSDVKPGTWLITFSKDGFLSGSGTSATLVADEVATAPEISLATSLARISGTASLESRTDFSGIGILAMGENGRNYSTITDPSGNWALSGMEVGTYRIQASTAGYVTAVSDPVILGAGAHSSGHLQTLRVSMRSVVGRIGVEGGGGASGIKVTATNITDIRTIYSALTNNEGYYVLAGMQPGSYILSFSKENYKGLTTDAIALDSNVVAMEELELELARGAITGIALSEGRTNHAGTTVLLVGTMTQTTTDANGVYEFQVPAGNYPGGVRFEREDFQTGQDAETITVLTDSTYGVQTYTLRATHNSAKGTIDLLNNTDEGIQVSIDGLAGFSATTGADGAWRIDHIPLGAYTIRFTKALTPDATSALSVSPSEIIDIGTIEMVPNASTLTGFIRLGGMSDHSGILVTVTTEGKPDRTAITNAAGRFTVDNIFSTGIHQVSASKAGWVSWITAIGEGQALPAFEPLEEREIGISPTIDLADATAPTISDVLINEGANITDDPTVTIRLSCSELGSGLDRMQVSWDGVFDVEPWEPYAGTFTRMVPANGNGEYRVRLRVKDKAGNISATAEDAITLSDLFYTLDGVLKGEDLHWRADKGIYKVIGTIVVEAGDTLIVDPGVEVQFTGAHAFAVRGSIKVRGTEGSPVIFTRDPSFDGRWTGLALQGSPSVIDADGYTYVSGSIIEHARFSHADTAISTNSYYLIRHCVFDASNGSINPRSSFLFNVDISCPINAESCRIVNSRIHDIAATWLENYLYGCSSKNVSIENLSGSSYNGAVRLQYGSMLNSLIREIGNGSSSTSIYSDSVSLSYSNVYNLWNTPAVRLGSGIGTTTAWTNVFWGYDKNAELLTRAPSGNLSFVRDYYDDPINLAKLQYSPYATEPWEFAGYKGEAFIDAEFNVNNWDFATQGANITETATPSITIQPRVLYAKNSVAELRIAQSMEGLMAASWSGFSGSIAWTIDESRLVEGYAELYLQVRDSLGNVSGVVSHRVPYDTPSISKLNLTEGKVFTNESDFTLNYSLRDGGRIVRREILLNNVRVFEEIRSGQWSWDYVNGSYGNECQHSQRLLIKDMGNGAYTLTIKASDETGRIQTNTVNFSINRLVDTSGWGAGLSWSAATGQPLKDANTYYLWHLDGDGAEAGGDAAKSINMIAGTGGLSGAASGVWSYSNLPLSITANNAFTVEWWQKAASGAISINGGPISNCYTGYLGWNFVVGAGSSSSGFYLPTQDQLDAAWHHITLVFRGNRAAAYLDGVLCAFSDGFSHTLFDSGTKLYMWSGNGLFDELRISTRARSGDEIRQYYEAAKDKVVP